MQVGGDLGRPRSAERMAQRQRLLDRARGFVVVPEPVVDAAERLEQARLDLRLVGELARDLLGAAVEDVAQRRLAAARDRRIGLFEQLGEELRDARRGRPLALLPLERPGEPPRLREHGEPEDGERDHQGRERRRSRTVPADQLAQTVDPARRAGGDRLIEEETLEIGGEIGRRAVAPFALLGHRFGEDPAELAVEVTAQALALAAPPRGDLRGPRTEPRQTRARRRRLLLADPAQGLGERLVAALERRRAREQLVEQRAERVDVGAGVEVEAHRGLLGAHGLGRADELAEAGEARAPLALRVDRPGDTEIDHLRYRTSVDGRDQDVRGLEVAVDDPLLMRMVDRAADRHEELDSARDRQAVAIAVLGDRRSVDQLHREVGAAVGSDARVEDLGDRSVLHPRQRLALRVEPAQDLARVHAQFDPLERDPPSYRRLLQR